MPWVERQPDTYQAYGGPDVGGFGLLPQSSLPTTGTAENSLSSLLKDVPVGDLPPLPSASTRVGNWVERTTAAAPAPPLAASTIAPKGGTPYQPNVLVDQALEDYRRLAQPLSRQKQAVKVQLAEDRSALGNIAQSHMTEVGNAILHAPSIAGDVLSYPVRRTIDYLKEPGAVPSTNVFGAVPRVGVEDVGAALGSLKQGGPTFEQARQNIDVNEAARREAYPLASSIGDLTGTVQTLGTLRGPFTEKLRDFEYKTTKQINKGRTLYQSAPFADKAARTKVLLQSPGFNALLRGAGRTAEAGLEGTAIAVLDEKDPSSAAAFSAGTQGLVSLGTEGLMRKFAKLPSRVATLAVNGAIMTGAIYGLGVLAPGEIKDYEAQKAAAHKIILGYTLGAGLSLVGARSRSGAASVDMPRLTDALASAPRNMMQKVMIDYLNADATGRKTLGEKLNSMQQNLGRFTDQQLRDLSASFNGSNVDRFYNELDKALKGLQSQ